MPVFDVIRRDYNHLARVLEARHDDYIPNAKPAPATKTVGENFAVLNFNEWKQHIDKSLKEIQCSSIVTVEDFSYTPLHFDTPISEKIKALFI